MKRTLKEWLQKLDSSKIVVILLSSFIVVYLAIALYPLISTNPSVATAVAGVAFPSLCTLIGYLFKLRRDEKGR